MELVHGLAKVLECMVLHETLAIFRARTLSPRLG